MADLNQIYHQKTQISLNEQCIIAQCTPKGSGAVAIIRLSGNSAISIVTNISRLGSGKLTDFASHTVHYGWVVDENEIIDQVMFILMHGPKTLTGQDIVEITCHNNPFIIERIIELAIQNGARLAQQGEFLKRAFLNEKIDLIQAEAVNELLKANTHQTLKKSLAKIKGSLSNFINQIESDLLKCLALSEASFEFIDDEIEFGPQIIQEIDQIIQKIQNLKQNFNQQQQIRDGIRIALIGSVNVGKSSLFNRLLNTDRAIVSEIAGTTRDSIEKGIYKNGQYITIIDTAGLRQTQDIIEQQGINRSFEEAEKADIILLIYDCSRLLSDQEEQVYNQIINKHGSKIIYVANKSDLRLQNDPTPSHPEGSTKCEVEGLITQALLVSTKTSQNIPELNQIIEQKISLLLKDDSPFLLNQRQFNLLIDLEKKLHEIKNMLSKPEYEILSIHINEALQSISELSGKNISEKGMDTIFKEFCVGK